ncbi:MFS transporter [Bacillus inaquosorum]|uniref:MFS transporter n=1 Tax=Bacillus inaquosorum TaxID=483913 RepID=UPI00031BF5AA|nr:MFS transporter [Bacillus inaquosorum]MCY7977792.1 MFS transporter [Bacillus inaquosorum]MCY8140335.1 MFS transporter [Bacillus inaquosorum]MCY8148327.1 MFS transporter [Bacillus inaquosorum]MCY8277229.1 MFS transporter [Bacillus inaquosorum]MCY8282153.1 MFS transporter [Bacillus inaquosorum]
MNFKKIIILGALLLGTFISVMDTTIVNIALPEMLTDFSCTLSQVAWVATGYTLAFAVMLVAASKLADHFGRKKAFIFGLALFIFTSFLACISGSIEMLIAIRVIQGLSAAFIVPVTMPIALEIVPEEKKGMIIGIWGAFSGLAATLGPVLGGLLTENFNWQSIFFINIPLGIIAIFFAAIFITESYDNSANKKVDYIGMLILSGALFCLTFGFAKVSDLGWTSSTFLIFMSISMLLLMLFLYIESKIKYPMVPLSMLKVKTFTFSSLTLFMQGLGLTSGTLIITLLLTNLMGKTELEAGLIVSVLALSSMFTSVLSGKLSDKLGGALFSSLGMMGLTISTYLYSYIRYDSSISLVIILLCISGLALGLIIGPAMGSGIRLIPPEKIGIASGILNMMRTVGQAVGIAILTSVLTTSINHHVDSATKEAVKIVEDNAAFDEMAKTEIIAHLHESNSNTFDQEKTMKELNQKEEELLSKTPKPYKDKVKEKFKKQREQVIILQNKIAELYNEKISDSFNFTFKIGSIILILGIIFSLFSDISPRKLRVKQEKTSSL